MSVFHLPIELMIFTDLLAAELRNLCKINIAELKVTYKQFLLSRSVGAACSVRPKLPSSRTAVQLPSR